MITFALMLSASLLAAAPDDDQAVLRIENAWVREAPPVARVLAAYARLCNDSSAPVTLSGASSPRFERVEMHTTIKTDTTATMERLKSVTIGAHDCASFEPSGRHFMLFEPDSALRAGDDVTFTLELSDGKKVKVTFPVRRAGEMTEQQNEHHHDGH